MFKALRDKFRRLGRDEDGAALVEMALITPFMLVLSAGVFEFSNVLHTRLLIEAGVEDAARYIARCSDTWANCSAYGKNLAVNASVTGGTARVSGWTTSQVTVSSSSFPAMDASGNELYLSSAGAVTVVQVSASYPYVGTGLWTILGFGNLSITASHQERVIGW